MIPESSLNKAIFRLRVGDFVACLNKPWNSWKMIITILVGGPLVTSMIHCEPVASDRTQNIFTSVYSRGIWTIHLVYYCSIGMFPCQQRVIQNMLRTNVFLTHEWFWFIICKHNKTCNVQNEPGTQMTLILIGTGLLLEGWPSKIEVQKGL